MASTLLHQLLDAATLAIQNDRVLRKPESKNVMASTYLRDLTDKLSKAGSAPIGLSGSTLLSVDLGLAPVFSAVLSENALLSLSGERDGGKYLLILQQDATGSRTVSFTGTAIAWSAGSTPAFSTAGSAVDIVALMYSASLGRFLGEVSIGFDVP